MNYTLIGNLHYVYMEPLPKSAMQRQGEGLRETLQVTIYTNPEHKVCCAHLRQQP